MTKQEAALRKKEVGERMILTGYNQFLFERGIITEDERNRMKLLIDARRVAADNS